MTAMVIPLAGASSIMQKDIWPSINWSNAKKHVLRLQMRIAKAVREGRQQYCPHFWVEDNSTLLMLERSAGNLARSVLRGLLPSNGEWPLDYYAVGSFQSTRGV